VPKPVPGPKQLLVKMQAAALNHRDLFIRQHLYPGISFENPMLADGCGLVVELGPDCTATSAALRGKSVLITPNRGWESALEGPEDLKSAPTGSTVFWDFGCAQEWVVVDEDEVIACPEHLTPAEGAALPLVGLTGWRAFVTKSNNALPGRNILIPGIGGGVALQVLQFAVAMGCNVFVTSGDSAKIDQAVAMGAKGGVLYRDGDWGKKLSALLPEDRPFIDAVIDGAGGDILAQTMRMLKLGGVVVCYGMTLGPKMDWLVQGMLKNVELKGTMMGSKKEFRDMVEFVREKKIHPVVSRVVRGLVDLEGIDALFEDMKAGKQFGKLVIQIDTDRSESPSKL
jgi:NADPH:quinone reductase-like Zn-dependent oxidoreductase